VAQKQRSPSVWQLVRDEIDTAGVEEQG